MVPVKRDGKTNRIPDERNRKTPTQKNSGNSARRFENLVLLLTNGALHLQDHFMIFLLKLAISAALAGGIAFLVC